LEKSLREDDKFIRNKENKHQVELKDGDFYDDLDKDDMLDRLGQHNPSDRMYWEKLVELSIHHGSDGILIVNLGADDPTHLDSEEAFQLMQQ
jgi:hypothetical protein